MSDRRPDRAGPFQATCCEMPTPAPAAEAAVYRSFRDLVIKAHCADKRPSHRCAGQITISRDAITLQCPRCGITLQCPRCGDAKEII